MYIYIYIYIERERDMCVFMCIYIYIYIYVVVWYTTVGHGMTRRLHRLVGLRECTLCTSEEAYARGQGRRKRCLGLVLWGNAGCVALKRTLSEVPA